MSREEEIQEKARELAIKYCKDIDSHGKEVYNIGCAIACCEMADWADKHPRKGLWDSEKVIEWIKNNFSCSGYGFPLHYSHVSYQPEDIIRDLRKAMEEQQ